MTEKTDLYRHFNSLGELLYIGISINAAQRFKSHAAEKSWADQVSRIEIEKFQTRDDALKAEEIAIKKEKPLYNFVYNRFPKRYEKNKSTFIADQRAKLIGPLKPLMVSKDYEFGCNETGMYLTHYLVDGNLVINRFFFRESKAKNLNKWGGACYNSTYFVFIKTGEKKIFTGETAYRDFVNYLDSKGINWMEDGTESNYEKINNAGWCHHAEKFGDVSGWLFN